MKNEFVSYEVALKLKELGFDEPCLCAYDKNEMLYHSHKTDKLFTILNSNLSNQYSAPLYQQVFRWFRKQFNWQSSIEATKDQLDHELGYNYWIWNSETGEEYHTMPKNRPFGGWCFTTFEEAQIECIKELISTIKNQVK
jgi:hypothetical protein